MLISRVNGTRVPKKIRQPADVDLNARARATDSSCRGFCFELMLYASALSRQFLFPLRVLCVPSGSLAGAYCVDFEGKRA